MIYRISIGKEEDGKWVHERYATDDEHRHLHLMPDGNLIYCNFFSSWRDVSATHRVEWGYIEDGLRFYENDIARLCLYNGGKDGQDDRYYVGKVVFGNISSHSNSGWHIELIDGKLIQLIVDCPSQDTRIIGNIHENPDLLEGK